MVKSDFQVAPLSWDTCPVDSMVSGPRNRAVERCEKSSSRLIIDHPASSTSSSKTRVIPRTSKWWYRSSESSAIASGKSGWSYVQCWSTNAPSSTRSYRCRPVMGSGMSEWCIVTSQVPSSRSSALMPAPFVADSSCPVPTGGLCAASGCGAGYPYDLGRRSRGFPGGGFGLPSPRTLGLGGGFRQPEEAQQAFDGRPVALDLYLPDLKGFVEVAILVDERGERVDVSLDPRVRVGRGAAVDPDAPVLHLETEALVAEHHLVASIEVACGLGLEHCPERDHEPVHPYRVILAPPRGPDAPAPDGGHHLLEISPPVRELVDLRGRGQWERAPAHHPRQFERLEAVGEDVRADAGQALAQVREALGPEQELAHHEQRPALPPEVQPLRRP